MLIAVIDIGTRATRLIIGDTTKLISDGFNFKDYRNEGTLTEAGNGIFPTENNGYEYRIQYLESTIKYLYKLVKICRNSGVSFENIHIVGTEVFRRVHNWKDITELIKNHCGLRVQVLSPIEEAECTFFAAMISCRDYYDIEEPFIVIEQGGGSMQITVSSIDKDGRRNNYGQTSIPELGTLLLRRKFVDYGSDGERQDLRRVGTVDKEVRDFANTSIKKTLSTFIDKGKILQPSNAFALGTVITKFYKKSNKEIHCLQINKDEIQSEIQKNLINKYSSYAIKSLFKDSENRNIPETKGDIDIMLENLYSLPCYLSVLDYFGLDSLRICGTGLRYGVFFRIAYDEWKNIREFNNQDTYT